MLTRSLLAPLILARALSANASDDPLDQWRKDAKISVVSPEKVERRTTHSYSFPESSVGKRINFNISSRPWSQLHVAEIASE